VSGAGDSMFPDPPEPPPLIQTAAQGPWGGPSYEYRGARIAGAAKRSAASLPKLQCTVRIPVHEDSLDCNFAGRIGIDKFRDVTVDLEQPAGQRTVPHPDTSARDVADTLLAGVHDTVTRDSRSGIEAEDSHHGSYDSHSP